jgi:hypothetical protein
MEKWVNAVFTSCTDPVREKEFNEWYNDQHLPDVFKTKEIKKATRYQIKDAATGEPKYLALYEIETDDIEKTMAVDHENIGDLIKQGRMSRLCKVEKVILCQQIYEARNK